MSEQHWMSILVDRLYSQFIYRDLVYVGGGVLILAVPFRVYSLLQYLINAEWWLFVVVVLAAYALGFFAMHLGLRYGDFRMFLMTGLWVDAEVDAIQNELRVARNWNER